MSDEHANGLGKLTRRRLIRSGGAVSPLLLSGCSGLGMGTDQEVSATETTTSTERTENPETTPDVDVQAILDDLTLREKAGQMTLLALNGQVSPKVAESYIEKPGVGGVLYGAANPGTVDPEQVASRMNDLQKTATGEADHGLAMVAGIDAVHGNATNRDAVVFPHNVGMGATWRPDLVRKRAEVTSRSMRAMGFQWNFAPVADVLYDPRWGRFYEGFHESPSAVSSFVTAAVDGLESNATDHPTKVASSVKHFAGYSMPDAGNDRDNARIPLRDLREIVFPPFQDGVDAGAETVMANSGAINGIPAHASEWLLRTVLREQMGFEGVLVSDWADIRNLYREHAYLGQGQFEEAVAVVLDAGVDMYMAASNPGEFIDAVVNDVENDAISEERVDDAVRRILRFKKRLGLLDDPAVDPGTVGDRVVTEEDFERAREAAEQSMTLLTNDQALPLDDPDQILVTGPNADDPVSQLGGWTLGWQGVAAKTTPPVRTVLSGILERAPDATTVEHVGTGSETLSNRNEVASAAAEADVVVAVLGEGAYAEGQGDVESLELPPGQRELLTTIDEASTTSVGVLVAGRPRGGDHLFETLDAALMAYYPGSEGGAAVARTLFGDVNPGGRLPFTWPSSTGDVPVASTVRQFVPEDASRFGVGHGESYTDLPAVAPQVDPSPVDPAQTDSVEIEYTVENTSDRPGDHLARATLLRVGSDPKTRPWVRLGVFERITVESGEERSVTLDVPLERLAVVDGGIRGQGEKVVPAGTYVVFLEGTRLQFRVTQTVQLE